MTDTPAATPAATPERPSASSADIGFTDVDVAYPNGYRALRNVSLTIPEGQMVGVVGLSGAGKSTLVRTVNGLVTISSGRITIGDHEVAGLTGRGLRALRSRIGMVFQDFNLANRTTVLNNVLMGRLYQTSTLRTLVGAWKSGDVDLAMDALARVEILPKAYTRASQLSGGQKQRVAIARTLAQKPDIILADEPVASLDPPTSHVVMRDLQRINAELGITVITNLHFLDLARSYSDRLIGLRTGEVVYDGPSSEADDAVFESIYGRSLTADDVLDTTDDAAPQVEQA